METPARLSQVSLLENATRFLVLSAFGEATSAAVLMALRAEFMIARVERGTFLKTQ